MALVAIAPSPAGGAVTYQNATAGDGTTNGNTIAPGSGTLHVRNADASPITVTVKGFAPCSHGVVHDVTYTVGATSDRLIPAPDPNRFTNADGKIHVGYSAVTSVTVGLIGA